MPDSPAPAPAGERATKANVFTKKLGPLPMWAWVAIIGAAILGWAYYKNRTASNAAASSASSVPADQVPQFVNQTYTTVTAPPAPSVTVNAPEEPEEPAPPPPGKRVPPPHPPVRWHPKAPAPRPPRKGPAEPIFNGRYTVRPGDTLNSVAKRYKITREQLAHANGYGTGAGLRTGETLKVPSPPPGGTPNRAP